MSEFFHIYFVIKLKIMISIIELASKLINNF